MQILLIVVAVVGIGVLAYAGFLLHSILWLRREVAGDRFFARTLAGRRALRDEIRRRSRLVVRLIEPLTRIVRIRPPSGSYRGVVFPLLACPKTAFVASTRYRPQRGDVFVATQMKCGTTWMQQIVYEILMRGRGNLGDDGHRHMYALSPWIESKSSVPLSRAPRVGERGERIIKTHHETTLCPYSEDARYVYVTRHPVACFASFVDFQRMLSGPITWTLPELLEIFCSEEMWWRSWPHHVDGWWRWAQERPNVLFVHYEDMLDDLGAAVDQVAAFLETSLEPEERAAVVRKSGYDYMKANEELFEMSPPTYFSVLGGSHFESGKKERDRDVGPAERDRIVAFCRERLKDSPYPLARFYPDVAGG